MSNKVVIIGGKSALSSLKVKAALSTIMVHVASRDFTVSKENAPSPSELAWMPPDLVDINEGVNPTPRGPKPRKRW